jgi:hypothetical protein
MKRHAEAGNNIASQLETMGARLRAIIADQNNLGESSPEWQPPWQRCVPFSVFIANRSKEEEKKFHKKRLAAIFKRGCYKTLYTDGSQGSSRTGKGPTNAAAYCEVGLRNTFLKGASLNVGPHASG